MDRTVPAPAPQVPPGPDEGDEPRHGGHAAWTVVDCIGVFLFTLLSALVVSVLVGFVLAVALGGAPGDPPPSRPLLTVVSQAIFFVVLFATVLAWTRLRYPGHARGVLGSRSPNGRDLLVGLGLGVAAFAALNLGVGTLVELLTSLLGTEPPAVQEDFQDLARNPETAPYFLVLAAVFAPLAEEAFFRGMLYPALAGRLGVRAGIVLTALPFALLHAVEDLVEGDLAGAALVVGLILPLGLLLAWVYHRRGTLAAPVLVHAVFNLLGVVGIMLFGEDLGA